MTYCTWQIVHIPWSTSLLTWDTASSSVLPHYYDVQISNAFANERSDFSFKITNFNRTYDDYFTPNDKLVFYRKLNSTTINSSDQIMIGTVQQCPVTNSGTKNFVNINGFNFSDILLGALAYGDLRGLTIPVAMQLLINYVTNTNSNFSVTWNTTNPTTTSALASFPLVQETWNYRSLKEFMEKYSTRQATGDGDYFYYVDLNNKLVWGRKSDVSAGNFNSSTDTYKTLVAGKDLQGVRNFFIVKGGIDPDGSPIQILYRDEQSIAKYGLKPYIITNIAQNAESVVKADKDTAGVTDMKNASYSFVTTWDGISYSSYANYVAGLRTWVKARCQEEGKRAADTYSQGVFKHDLTVRPGSYSWVLSDLITTSVVESGASNKPLRVKKIVYETTKDTFNLEEDIGTL